MKAQYSLQFAYIAGLITATAASSAFVEPYETNTEIFREDVAMDGYDMPDISDPVDIYQNEAFEEMEATGDYDSTEEEQMGYDTTDEEYDITEAEPMTYETPEAEQMTYETVPGKKCREKGNVPQYMTAPTPDITEAPTPYVTEVAPGTPTPDYETSNYDYDITEGAPETLSPAPENAYVPEYEYAETDTEVEGTDIFTSNAFKFEDLKILAIFGGMALFI